MGETHHEQPWSLSRFEPESHLTEWCFNVMANQLRFNICDIKTSYLYDSKYIPKLGSKDIITQTLRYACRHWSEHLGQVHDLSPNTALIGLLSHNHFLFWVEVVSLLEFSSDARDMCDATAGWVQVSCLSVHLNHTHIMTLC